MKDGEAHNTRAIEVDHAALADFYDSLDALDVGYEWMYRIGKKSAGRLLDGVTHDAMPAVSHKILTEQHNDNN